MDRTLKYIAAFSVGAAVGAVITWKVLETKYDKISRDEIESVRDTYHKKTEQLREENDKLKKQAYEYLIKNKPSLDECAKKIKVDDEVVDEPKEMDDVDKPYILRPDEFGELYDYESITLEYYSDGILTDELDNPIDDIDEIIGYDSLDHFGEYEDDCIYVRNDKRKTDYEVLLNEGSYADFIGYPSED